ncbi:Putative WD repeat-containing protein DCAF7 [Septoria linicola]|uniref:WD repeat-containing protein DCAF7 n=1 Tax=Septoria linicola TaxID=215465 RepID=A0A9Q9EF06_9PEZI|nr:putative WD repeat-containing protein DCAF7 [Septoria linicola]USW47117.1 Putative WD repeat-containing protein DCAF7 [Septoria linicola]
MPFHLPSHQKSKSQHSAGEGIFQAVQAASIGLGADLQRLAHKGSDTFADSSRSPYAEEDNSDRFDNHSSINSTDHVMAQSGSGSGRGLFVDNDLGPPPVGASSAAAAAAAAPMSAPGSTLPGDSHQPLFSSATPATTTARRQHERAPSLQDYLPPQQQYSQSPYSLSPQPTPSHSQGFLASSVIPSNASSAGGSIGSSGGAGAGGGLLGAGLPGALQPAGGSRPAVSTAYTAPTTIPTMQSPPLQNNASQYSQPPSRSNTLHSHSRSSPSVGTLDGPSKYIPFNQTPAQTPTTSNPKAYNLSNAQTPQSGAGPSHSPLNLTDIRSRAISDANEGPQGTAFFSYSDQPTNSNYLAPFPTYAFDWCKWPVQGGSGAGKIAVGSYLEDPHNFIQILDTHIKPQDASGPGNAPYGIEYSKVAEATCAYPVTRILWEPPSSQKSSTDLLATSGDHLRLWSLPAPSTPHSSHINRSASTNIRDPAPQKLQPLALLSNSKTPEHTAPLTSLDWNTLSPKLIITSSIDTTCTIWDIPTLTAKTQLIAHDKEVFDVRFCAGSVDVFVSCGADGSVRMFDLRSLEHSTIIYEPAEKGDKSASPSASSPSKSHMPAAPPLLRLAASPHDAHLLATFASDSNIIRILDVRQPGTALLELRGHQGNLNTIEWNPSRRGMLASGADDSMVLVWDLLNSQNQATVPALNGNGAEQAASASKGPFANWRCEYEVANVSWAPQSQLTNQGGDWLGVCAGRGVWGVKI